MAINQNHLCEELDGIKCAIVEKNVLKERSVFLQALLELNQYTVVVIPSPPPKNSALSTDAATSETSTTQTQVSETFTVGVTDVKFNPVNAIFGRLLRTKDGHVVTLPYWQQKEQVSYDNIPYYESR